jgi:ribonuclease HII
MLKFERAWWARSFFAVAGVDEAGRGCLAGPVVAAAAIFPPDFLIPRVNDSKKLSPKVREALYPEIITQALAFGVGIVDATEIDHINILQASRKAMVLAVQALAKKPDVVLVDGRDALDLDIPQETIIDGDALSHAIAAASIVAKVTRDRMMHAFQQQFPNFGFANHKGYGTGDHLDEIRRFGPTPIHRRSFKGVVNG